MKALLVFILLFSGNTFASSIGSVTNNTINSIVNRNKVVNDLSKGSSIETLDELKTGNGTISVTFEDDTLVEVSQNSKLIVDDFVYNPKNKSVGALSLKFAIGTIRYASGNIAHANNKNVAINTPTATIAVRGTAFSTVVDEIGQSTIILLPNLDGSVGEIEVRTAVGSVVLNQAFQATVTTSNEVKPIKPVLLMINESAINNMMIVKPPKEITQKLIEENNKSGSTLDFTGLEKDALAIKIFVDPFATFNQLNVDALSIDYLINVLDANYSLTNFVVGYSSVSQIYIFDKDTYWLVQRTVQQSAIMMLNKTIGYNITLIQDSATTKMQNLDTTTSNIYIKQSGN